MENIETMYPNTYQFFAGYFFTASFDNTSDDEIISQYKIDCSRKEFELTLKELKIIQQEIFKCWKDISLETNKFFESEIAAKKWIDKIILKMEKV